VVISPNPSLHNQELGVRPQVDVSRRRLAPAMKVLRCVYAAVSRILRSQRQDGLPGLGKVWKPTLVARDHREVAREGVV